MQAWKTQFSGNLDNLKTYLLQIEEFILKSYNSHGEDDLFEVPTTNRFTEYNIFTFPNEDLRILFSDLQKLVIDVRTELGLPNVYYIQSWINVSRKHQLDWHHHFERNTGCFHGYFAIDAEPSETHYLLDDGLVKIPNENGRIFLGEAGYAHKVGDWFEDRPRITLAYDIVPGYILSSNFNPNHWLPI